MDKKSKLSESIGKLDSLKQRAKEEFGTDSIEKSKFEQFKKTLDFKKSKLSESIGKLDSLKQQAKEEFGTDSIEKLKKTQEKYEQEKENVESQIRELESTITTILNEMDEDDE